MRYHAQLKKKILDGILYAPLQARISPHSVSEINYYSAWEKFYFGIGAMGLHKSFKYLFSKFQKKNNNRMAYIEFIHSLCLYQELW